MESNAPVTLVGNSLGSWIAWLVAREFLTVDELILIAPAFNMMANEPNRSPTNAGMSGTPQAGCRGVMMRSTRIGRCHGNGSSKANSTGRRPSRHFAGEDDHLHGLQDTVIAPDGSRR